MASSFSGVKCTDCEALYPEGQIEPPCPKCDSRRRTFCVTLEANTTPSGTLEGLRSDRDGQPLGYFDTGRHGTTRHGNVESDEAISLQIEGRPPQNEEDTERVCQTLATALSNAGRPLTATATSTAN